MTRRSDLDVICEAARAIQDNARIMANMRDERVGYASWAKQPAATRERILMELRHDLEDALKSVKRLEEAGT